MQIKPEDSWAAQLLGHLQLEVLVHKEAGDSDRFSAGNLGISTVQYRTLVASLPQELGVTTLEECFHFLRRRPPRRSHR